MCRCVRLQGDDHIASVANATAVRVVHIADYLSQMVPGTTVLIMGLLPRGDVTVLPAQAAFALPSKCAPSRRHFRARARMFDATSHAMCRPFRKGSHM
jgi:hypothetical protein